MFESIFVTVFPVLFLIVLVGGDELFRRKNIHMGGEPPVDKRLFLSSKYLILVVWGAAVLQAWGIGVFLLEVPDVLKRIAVFLWISGFTLLLIGRLGMGNSFRIGSPKENTRLKVIGLFRFSRNPMYVGVYATLLAAALFTLNPLVIVVGIFISAVHHKIVLAEELYLQKAFGEEYAEYRGRVRRYL